MGVVTGGESAPELLTACGLGKAYAGVRVLDDVSLQIGPGEVHAVCGENGAGKSTLIKILTGVVAQDVGTIMWRGLPLIESRVSAREAAGIAVMHQESTAFPDLNAVDNLFVGREWTWGRGLFLRRAAMRRQAEALFERLGERLDLETPIGQLTLAQRQMVALARALLLNCRLLIMDEPTASLSARETEALLRLVRQLRSEGVSVLYVSHRLEEVFALADRITVLRDGRRVLTEPATALTPERLVAAMVGRELPPRGTEQRLPTLVAEPSPRLQVTRLTRMPALREISLAVRAGEIVGLAGLVGAGRTELLRAVFGIDRYDAGSVQVAGCQLRRGAVRAAVRAGMALVPEDRQFEGLALPMSVADNLLLASRDRLARWGWRDRKREQAVVEQQLTKLAVRAAGSQVAVATLSGGNQQKVVLGRWLATEPRVLLLDEPTRGVDVGAKMQIHELIRELAAAGCAVLVASSELAELINLCQRILVMRAGRVVADLPAAATTQDELLRWALPDGTDATEPLESPQ